MSNSTLTSLVLVAATLAFLTSAQAQEQRCNRAVSQGIIDVGDYFSADDHLQPAIVSNGRNLYEIFSIPPEASPKHTWDDSLTCWRWQRNMRRST